MLNKGEHQKEGCISGYVMPKDTDDDTQRLLGRLIAKLDSVEDFAKRINQEQQESRRQAIADQRENRAERDQQIDGLKKEVALLREYVQEHKGGKKMLAALLAASAAFGGIAWEVLTRVLTTK